MINFREVIMNFQKLKLGIINFQKLKLGIPKLKFMVPGHHQFSIFHIVNYFPSALIKIRDSKIKIRNSKIKIRNWDPEIKIRDSKN